MICSARITCLSHILYNIHSTWPLYFTEQCIALPFKPEINWNSCVFTQTNQIWRSAVSKMYWNKSEISNMIVKHVSVADSSWKSPMRIEDQRNKIPYYHMTDILNKIDDARYMQFWRKNLNHICHLYCLRTKCKKKRFKEIQGHRFGKRRSLVWTQGQMLQNACMGNRACTVGMENWIYYSLRSFYFSLQFQEHDIRKDMHVSFEFIHERFPCRNAV